MKESWVVFGSRGPIACESFSVSNGLLSMSEPRFLTQDCSGSINDNCLLYAIQHTPVSSREVIIPTSSVQEIHRVVRDV
jgi:hypothetical protein